MKNKKGDISIGIIVSAAIALVVLIVIILIFTGSIGRTSVKIENQSSSVAKNACPDESNWKTSCLPTERQMLLPSDAASHAGLICCVTNP